jgi:hypothetical protein
MGTSEPTQPSKLRAGERARFVGLVDTQATGQFAFAVLMRLGRVTENDVKIGGELA